MATGQDSPGIGRRSLLKGGAALTAVVGLVGGVGFVVLDGPAPGFRILSPAEVATVQALGEALFPPGNPLGVSGLEVDVAARVDELLAEWLDPMLILPTRYLLRGFRVGSMVSRASDFSSLPLADREEVMEVWSHHDLLPRRLAYDALRSVIGLSIFLDDRMFAATGWETACASVPV